VAGEFSISPTHPIALVPILMEVIVVGFTYQFCLYLQVFRNGSAAGWQSHWRGCLMGRQPFRVTFTYAAGGEQALHGR
jgi:hypothetical protein